jgi:hypothetical protein
MPSVRTFVNDFKTKLDNFLHKILQAEVCEKFFKPKENERNYQLLKMNRAKSEFAQ